MLDLIVAAALLQTDPACHAVGALAPRNCPAWQALVRDTGGEVFSEAAPLSRNGNHFDLRVRLIFAADQDGGMRSAIAIYRFDCAAETAVLQHNRVFNARGELLHEGPVENAEVLSAPAGTPNRVALDRFCPRR